MSHCDGIIKRMSVFLDSLYHSIQCLILFDLWFKVKTLHHPLSECVVIKNSGLSVWRQTLTARMNQILLTHSSFLYCRSKIIMAELVRTMNVLFCIGYFVNIVSLSDNMCSKVDLHRDYVFSRSRLKFPPIWLHWLVDENILQSTNSSPGQLSSLGLTFW